MGKILFSLKLKYNFEFRFFSAVLATNVGIGGCEIFSPTHFCFLEGELFGTSRTTNSVESSLQIRYHGSSNWRERRRANHRVIQAPKYMFVLTNPFHSQNSNIFEIFSNVLNMDFLCEAE